MAKPLPDFVFHLAPTEAICDNCRMKIKLALSAVALSATALFAAPLDCAPQKWDASPISWRFDAAASTIRANGRAIYASYLSPDARRTTFTARVKPEKRTGGDWSVIGLSIGSGEKDFWHVALVVSPTNLGSRLTCELAEMREGHWLSHHADKLHMKFHRAPGSWSFGGEYILSISLDADGVQGSVKDTSGKTIFESAYSFADKPAVRSGHPAIHTTGGFCSLVKNLDAESEGMIAAVEKKQTFPPYESASFAPEIKDAATGFFHTAEKNGKWWVIDPLGRGTVLLGIDHVAYNGHWSKRTKRALYREWNDAHYPNREAWVDETIGRLKAWGFNMLGAGGHAPLEHHGLIHTKFLSMGDSLCWNEQDDEFWICINEHRPCSAFPNVFHPLFAAHCDYVARKNCAPFKDDPWLLGYFIDNELAWWGRGPQATGLFDAAMAKSASHTARQALDSFVAAEISRRGLKAPFGKLPRETRDEIKHAFLRLAAEKYFSATSAAIRRHDPNHMVLGARFAGLGGADPVVWEVSGKYSDIVTFNCYPWADIDRNVVLMHSGRNATRVADAFAARHAIVKKPMLITEWSFPALDSGLPCTGGAGQRFFTQKERTAATELFAKTMLSLPFLVGYDYFMWVDEPAAGISDEFPEDSNYGLVNEQGVPYPEITSMFTRLQRDIGRWRAAPLPKEREASAVRAGLNADELRASAYNSSGKTVFIAKGPAAGHVANSAGLALDYGTPPNRRGMAVTLNGREIGDYCSMLHVALPGDGQTWIDASRVSSAEWKDNSLYVTFLSRDGRFSFSMLNRITPSPDRATFLAELMEVKNTGKTPINVKHFFFRAYAQYAGEVQTKGVPNLWKGPRADAWFAADGRWFGLKSKAPSANACNFFWNASGKSQHPDAICEPSSQLTIAPGASYVPPEGTTWYEAVCGLDGPDGWKRAIRRVGE